jgi:hypothetical protein
MKLRRLGAITIVTLCAVGCGSTPTEAVGSVDQDSTTSPYPPSTVFDTIDWDFNITRLAGGPGLDGSDLWAMTWDTNGDLYGVWGDGAGFGVTSADGPSGDKAFMGVSRIVGAPPPTEFGSNPTATNIWGGIGTSPTQPLYTDGTPAYGKGNNLFSVEDSEDNDVMVLNVAVQNASHAFTGSLVAYSLNEGKTWAKIANTSGFSACGGGVNFGPGSTGTPAAFDGFTYGYDDGGNSTGTLLCREPKSDFSKTNIANLGDNQSHVQWFTGLSAQGEPQWGAFEHALGVIKDTQTEDTIVTYDAAVSRFLAVYEFNRPANDDAPIGALAVLDGPTPWGPWTTVGYYLNWGGSAFTGATVNLSTTILPNWFGSVSGGSQSFCAVFSGTGSFDAFNLLCNSKLVLKSTTTPLVTINSVSTGEKYATVNAAVGDPIYIDRTYDISTLSSALVGGTLIQTANSDKQQTTSKLLTFTLSRAATVYVAYDTAHITGLPAWLSGWTETSDVLSSATNPNALAHVFSKALPAGEVVLGGNGEAPAQTPGNSCSNYAVIAK